LPKEGHQKHCRKQLSERMSKGGGKGLSQPMAESKGLPYLKEKNPAVDPSPGRKVRGGIEPQRGGAGK